MMTEKQHNISFNQKQLFFSLFNRGGYVLNFSTPDFDRFTRNSVGIAVCEKYGMSKGKSLEEFCDKEDESKVIKLLTDLLEYYENHYQCEINIERESYSERYAYYKKCREIIDSLSYSNTHIAMSTKKIREKFSSEYLKEQIELMLNMQNKNPTEAIGKSKELIETCCKNILESENIKFDPKADVNALVKQTMKFLNVHVDCVSDSHPESKTIKKILGSLSGIASSLAELRNSHGSGHGKNVNYKGLTSRHAELAVGSSVTFVKYLWDTYEWRKSKL